MKNKNSIILVFTISAIAFACSFQNGKEPWTKKQLMNPADLAKAIIDSSVKPPIIFCIGPSGLIKSAVDIGPTKEKVNFEKLRIELSRLHENENIVIYCGCCPFKDCPNIRPAFRLLNEMKFTNHKLLDLPLNLKADWIAKGYPMSK